MLTKGTRVQLHPATDLWMAGDRYGVVTSPASDFYGKPTVNVKLDKSGRTLRLHASLIEPIA